eukprot:TRINITY_DN50852_c0_g4_i1.p1 TRINITY_DN50852_c0_g4~~TRINITY_DN50852_c0_g4_i1.p1  ORF type:complete len:552 (-),score=162.10 TRINITY_DN50852_c0_g4_i1:51-1706(-)
MASPARWVAVSSYWLVLVFGALVAWLVLQIERVPLPREEIDSLQELADAAAAAPRTTIHVEYAEQVFQGLAEAEAFSKGLAAALQDSAISVQLLNRREGSSALKACETPDADVAGDACQAALQAAAGSRAEGSLSRPFVLSIVPSTGGSALLLSTGLEALLRWKRKEGETAADLAAVVATALRSTWLRSMSFDSRAALFEIAPSYVMSFFLVGDCQQRVSWDFFGDIVGPYLQPFIARLQLLFDMEMDSQVVQCGALANLARSKEDAHVADAGDLQDSFLTRASEWPGDTVTKDARWLPPLLNFVAFKPFEDFTVLDRAQQPQQSFAIPGWGAVVLTNAGDDACYSNATGSLADCEAARVASAWAAHLRSWLQLPAEQPLGAGDVALPEGLHFVAASPHQGGLGIADWELRVVARGVYASFVRRTAETLRNLLDLVDSLPDVVVRAELGQMVAEAAAATREAHASATEGDLTAALAGARRAAALALSALHDDTVVAHLFFSMEFKYAVYLPIGLPIIAPILIATKRHFSRAMAVQKVQKQAVAEQAAAEAS